VKLRKKIKFKCTTLAHRNWTNTCLSNLFQRTSQNAIMRRKHLFEINRNISDFKIHGFKAPMPPFRPLWYHRHSFKVKTQQKTSTLITCGSVALICTDKTSLQEQDYPATPTSSKFFEDVERDRFFSAFKYIRKCFVWGNIDVEKDLIENCNEKYWVSCKLSEESLDWALLSWLRGDSDLHNCIVLYCVTSSLPHAKR